MKKFLVPVMVVMLTGFRLVRISALFILILMLAVFMVGSAFYFACHQPMVAK